MDEGTRIWWTSFGSFLAPHLGPEACAVFRFPYSVLNLWSFGLEVRKTAQAAFRMTDALAVGTMKCAVAAGKPSALANVIRPPQVPRTKSPATEIRTGLEVMWDTDTTQESADGSMAQMGA